MFRVLSLLLLPLITSLPAQGALSIDRALLVFEPGKPARQDVNAGNSGENNLFLEVEVLEVTRPGTPEEERQAIRDPESIGFIAAPRRLMVPPGGKRPVRMMNLIGHGDTERVYRVNIRPVLPPVESSGLGVRIVVAYQVLVFVAPRQTRVELNARREGNRLLLTNRGNVNILLSNGSHCPMLGALDCDDLKGRRLYPGNEWVVELPGNGPVQFDVETGGKRNRQSF
ncbi:MAG: molecular chaperone [Alcanivoracaceae bacterium]